MHIDSKNGIISLSAFGKPQMLIKLPCGSITVSDWRATEDGVVFKGRSGKIVVQVAQLTDLNSWVVRLDNLEDESAVKIESLLPELKRTGEGDGIVSDLGSHMHIWEQSQRLRFKEYGTVCVRTDGSPIQDKQFEFRQKKGKSSLNLVFLAANNAAAETRTVSFTEDEIVFNNDPWCRDQSLAPKGGKESRNYWLKIEQDGSLPADRLVQPMKD